MSLSIPGSGGKVKTLLKTPGAADPESLGRFQWVRTGFISGKLSNDRDLLLPNCRVLENLDCGPPYAQRVKAGHPDSWLDEREKWWLGNSRPLLYFHGQLPQDLAARVHAFLARGMVRTPDPGVLDRLFQVLYFASLKTEEAEPICALQSSHRYSALWARRRGFPKQ